MKSLRLMIYIMLNHTDIDECAVMLDLCGENGVCTDTSGSYTCGCLEGYEREGELCSSKYRAYH